MKKKHKKCKWKKKYILAGFGAGSSDYYCIVHKRFSGDNHKYHPKTPKRLRFEQ